MRKLLKESWTRIHWFILYSQPKGVELRPEERKWGCTNRKWISPIKYPRFKQTCHSSLKEHEGIFYCSLLQGRNSADTGHSRDNYIVYILSWCIFPRNQTNDILGIMEQRKLYSILLSSGSVETVYWPSSQHMESKLCSSPRTLIAWLKFNHL